MGAYSGFNVGWANASTISTAQPIAELPIFSGFSVRVVLNIINFAICYFFTIRYMKSIKADPKKSLNYEDGMSVADYMGAGKVAHAASRMPGDPCIRILNDLTEHRLDRSVGNPGIALHKFTQKRTFRSPTEVLFFCTSLHLSLQITDRNERYFFRFFYHVFFIYKSPVRSASTQPIGIAIQIPTSPIAVAESI